MAGRSSSRSNRRGLGFATRAILAAGAAPPVKEEPTAVPIYQTATFAAADSHDLAEILAGHRPGFAYSRLGNPTTAALARAYAELSGGEAGLAFSSGMAAIHGVVAALVRPGDRIVTGQALYGSTATLLAGHFGRRGIQVEAADLTDPAAVEGALAARPTRLLYAETLANPTLVVADIALLANLAHARGALLVVDNTFASPALCRPLELGADVVVESATKWLGGHSDVTAGVVAGPESLVAEIRRTQVETGGVAAPLDAFLVLRGLLTLSVRMERHAASAASLARWLEGQEGVRRVFYPGLPSHPQHALASRQLASGGGLLAFELEGGREAGLAFLDALRVAERTASLGSVRTIVVHPPSSTHRQLDDAALAAAGISPGLLRCSVGLEDLSDLQDDFARGLEAARAVARQRSSSVAAGAGGSPATARS